MCPRKASVENENRMIKSYSNEMFAFKIEDLNHEIESFLEERDEI